MIRYEVEKLPAKTRLTKKAAVFAQERDVGLYLRNFKEGNIPFENYAYPMGQAWDFPTWIIFQVIEPDTNEWGEVAP